MEAAPKARALARKQAIKNAVYAGVGAASRFSGATWLRGRAGGPAALRVLMYHKVDARPGNTLAVPPARLREQLDLVVREYAPVTPEHVLAAVRDGERLPERAVLLTFDDGYRDNGEHAYPLLRDLGLRALLFVATDFVGGSRPLPHDERLALPNPVLGWDELRGLQDVFAVGSHGRSHRPLTRISRSEAEAEIAGSKAELEQRLGAPVHFFGYPKGSRGDFDEGLERAVRAAGYAASFVTVPGPNSWERVRSGSCLRRYNAEPCSRFTFARLLEGSCDLVALKDTEWGQRAKRLFNRALGTATG